MDFRQEAAAHVGSLNWWIERLFGNDQAVGSTARQAARDALANFILMMGGFGCRC